MTGFTDIHCHILPGLDDGAKDRQMLEQMLEMAYQSGTRALIATSHYNPEVFNYTAADYEQRLILAKIAAMDIADDLKIYPGNEVFFTSTSVEDMLSGKIKTLADSQYVLVEFAPYQDFAYICKAVREVSRAGFWPVVAHAERYVAVAEVPERAGDLIAEGAYIQVNAAHLLGSDGKKVKNAIHKMLKRHEVHFIASDGHNVQRRTTQLKACADYLCQKFGEEQCRTIMIDNPGKIISKKMI